MELGKIGITQCGFGLWRLDSHEHRNIATDDTCHPIWLHDALLKQFDPGCEQVRVLHAAFGETPWGDRILVPSDATRVIRAGYFRSQTELLDPVIERLCVHQEKHAIHYLYVIAAAKSFSWIVRKGTTRQNYRLYQLASGEEVPSMIEGVMSLDELAALRRLLTRGEKTLHAEGEDARFVVDL